MRACRKYVVRPDRENRVSKFKTSCRGKKTTKELVRQGSGIGRERKNKKIKKRTGRVAERKQLSGVESGRGKGTWSRSRSRSSDGQVR